jgi:hypothetical protein
LPPKLRAFDVARRDLCAHLGIEPPKQLPGVGFEIAEDREAVPLPRRE